LINYSGNGRSQSIQREHLPNEHIESKVARNRAAEVTASRGAHGLMPVLNRSRARTEPRARGVHHFD
jgi:hypothetical protein